ncbi:alpha/beta fold hydrolase [Brotaphodocola sp.]|uniref:alpha/beta fold hydrolase n=1 Tax=Brotaphodocola sp. TaxID=3073577 RepID=UPI003D7E5BB4
MKAKNKLLTLLILSATTAASVAAINKIIKVTAVSKNLLNDDKSKSLCFKWRLGNVHYTKSGSGMPLLLIHDLNSASSGYEWSRIVSSLQNDYTVYTIDLLGCGRSEKANMTYTNYLYVQLISDFIKSEIGHRTSVIATGESASIPIMACANKPELFDQLMFINPLSVQDFCQMPGKASKMYKFVVELPMIGTLLYNIANSRQAIHERFVASGFQNPYSVKSSYVDAYYESAHLGASSKSMYASISCNYTRCNIVNALRKIDNSMYIIGGNGIEHIEDRLNEYKEYNSAIETALIPGAKGLPQLETPEELVELIRTYIH